MFGKQFSVQSCFPFFEVDHDSQDIASQRAHGYGQSLVQHLKVIVGKSEDKCNEQQNDDGKTMAAQVF
jgi:hypothetical protein